MSKQLTELTEQQKAEMIAYRDKFIEDVLTYKPINMEEVEPLMEFVWSLIEKPKPKIHWAGSPEEGQRIANELHGTSGKFYSFGTYLTVGWSSFYSYYDYFRNLGVITDEEFPKYAKLRGYLKTNIFLTLEFEEHVIVVERPQYVKRNERGLHCINGPAMEWKDGCKVYAINGRKIDNAWYEKCLSGSLTQSEFLNEKNDELRSAAFMVLSQDKLMKLVGATMIDTKTVVHNNGESETFELFRTKDKLNTVRNEPYAWLKRICPSTGTTYLTPTNPTFNDALESAKFHRPEFVPMDVNYSWFSRS